MKSRALLAAFWWCFASEYGTIHCVTNVIPIFPFCDAFNELKKKSNINSVILNHYNYRILSISVNRTREKCRGVVRYMAVRESNLVLVLVQLHGCCMSEELVVGHQVGLRAGIPAGAVQLLPGRAPPRREDPDPVPSHSVAPGLVQRYPVLHPVAELPEADLGIFPEVIPGPKQDVSVTNHRLRKVALVFIITLRRPSRVPAYMIWGLRNPPYSSSRA